MEKKNLKLLLVALGVLSLIFLIFIITIYSIIFLEVKRNCNNAQTEYKTICIEALAKVLESDNKTIKQKNDAIWTLGQIADKQSLKTLNKFYTGKIPEREPLDKVISQYELKKAIRWIENGNWTSWMYFMYH